MNTFEPLLAPHFAFLIVFLKITNITHWSRQICSTWRRFNPAPSCFMSKLFHAVHSFGFAGVLHVPLHCAGEERRWGQQQKKKRHFCFPTGEQRRQAGRDLWGTNTFICDNWDRASVSWLSAASEGMEAREREVKTQEVVVGVVVVVGLLG